MSNTQVPTDEGSAPRSRLRRGVHRSVVAVGAAAVLVLGSALPASAEGIESEANEQVATEVSSLLGMNVAAAADSPNALPTSVEIENLPAIVEAGTPLNLTVGVQNSGELLGSPAPSGQVALVAAVSAPQVGYQELGRADIVDGNAEIQVRPFALGQHELVAVYLGDENHLPAFSFDNTVEVRPVSAELALNFEPFDELPVAYNGSTLVAHVDVTSECVQQAESDADRANCERTFGAPNGTVTLTMDGEVVGEEQVVGTQLVGLPEWLGPDIDLTANEIAPSAEFEIGIPDRLLGSPDAHDFQATFTPSNWFAGAGAGPYTVATSTTSTVTTLTLGSIENSATEVRAEQNLPVQISVATDPSWGAPAEGAFNVYLDDSIVLEGLPFDGGLPVAEFDLVFTEDDLGEHTVRAEFVPATLNLTGSSSASESVTVTAPAPGPAPDPTPTPDPNPAPDNGGEATPGNRDAQGAKGSLAHTGSDSSVLIPGFASLLLIGAATSLAFARRRRMTGL